MFVSMFNRKEVATMSTSPYSQDLRKKVIVYLLQDNSQKQASQVFNIHENTVNRWWVRYQKEGSYAPRKRLGRPSKVNQAKLEKVVKSNPNIKLAELGVQFEISAWHASRILKKLGFSYKKKLYILGSKKGRARRILRKA